VAFLEQIPRERFVNQPFPLILKKKKKTLGQECVKHWVFHVAVVFIVSVACFLTAFLLAPPPSTAFPETHAPGLSIARQVWVLSIASWGTPTVDGNSSGWNRKRHVEDRTFFLLLRTIFPLFTILSLVLIQVTTNPSCVCTWR
jgi:hypothetical protein